MTTDTPETPAPKRAGRGPTRAAVKAADLIDNISALDLPTRVDLIARLRSGVQAAAVRAEIRAKRDAIRDTETRIRDLETEARLLAVADGLPETYRRFVLAAVSSEAAQAEAGT